MALDFSLPQELVDLRDRLRRFIETEVKVVEAECERTGAWRAGIIGLRRKARERGLWNPHMPEEWGGMGLGPVAMATVSAECGRNRIASYVLNCQAPDEGNMHTLLRFGTDEQKEAYLRPLTEGRIRSCFAMTEPEVACSDPTNLRTTAVRDGDDWLINGHKWFISGARGAKFAIVLACTDADADPPQARNTAFLVDSDNPGWKVVRDLETMAGKANHCEVLLEDVVVPDSAILGERGGGHRLGQARLGPGRLAHCMRWIGQCEIALEMMVERGLGRDLHGGKLADKQGIQWMYSRSALEIYQAKLMVLHAAYLLENDLPFRQEISMAKYHVANTLWRVLDRAVQVHGGLGYCSDSPLEQMMRNARSARLVDGSDEVHLSQMARFVIEAFRKDGSTRSATGYGLLY
ncbi:MAG: acyl-CoA dehydrogenase family protein [Candidatus Binatia bacterium]